MYRSATVPLFDFNAAAAMSTHGASSVLPCITHVFHAKHHAYTACRSGSMLQ
jgi:hypothetical protein